MGLFDSLFGSKSEQTTSYPGASAMEQRLQSLFMNAFLPQMIEESGYTMSKQGLTDAEQTQLDQLTKKLSKMPSGLAGIRGGRVNVEKQIKALQSKKDSPTLLKKYSPEIEELRELHGADSPQFKDAVKEFEGKRYQAEEDQRDLVNKFQENTMKFLSGDFAMSEGQKASMAELFAPERQSLQKMREMLGDNPTVDQYGNVSHNYGEVKRKLFEMGIEDMSHEVTNKVMADAVANGRDPADPEFVNMIGQTISREATRGGLALESDLIDRRMGVESAGLDLETQARNLRMGSLTGGGGMSLQSAQLSDAIAQQRMANLGAVSGGVMGEANSLRQMRMGQATTTTTGTPSPFAAVMGVATGAANIYSGYQSGQHDRLEASKLRKEGY